MIILSMTSYEGFFPAPYILNIYLKSYYIMIYNTDKTAHIVKIWNFMLQYFYFSKWLRLGTTYALFVLLGFRCLIIIIQRSHIFCKNCILKPLCTLLIN